MQELTPFEQHIAAILESVYHSPVSKEMVFETTDSAGQAAPIVRLCHAQIPSGLGVDGSIREDGHTARSVVSTSTLPHSAFETASGSQALSRSMKMETSIQTTGTTVAITTPDLDIVDGQITTTSNQVAQHFGKLHKSVLRAISKLECSREFTERNFAPSEYLDSTGRSLPCYRLTRDGFTFLAMGFTGKNAAQWKEAYISAFNKMEAELLKQQAPAHRPYNPAIDYERISPAQAQDIKELVQMIVDAGVQGYGETYNRLHRKFRVNSYLELPATKYDEVCMYLRAKLPKTYAPAPGLLDDVDVPALLLSGQSDPKPLTPAQHALIDQTAGRLVGEAYPLIRAHLERRVSWNTNQAQRQSGDAEVVQQVLGAATLGNCLAHHLHSEAQSVRLLLQTMRQRIDGVLGSYEQPLGLAH